MKKTFSLKTNIWWLLVALLVFVIVFISVMCTWSETIDASLFFIWFCELFFSFFTIHFLRRLSYRVEITGTQVRSFDVFSKNLCLIDTSSTSVYYFKFWQFDKPYIVIADKPFSVPSNADTYLNTFRSKSQIALFWDEEVKELFHTDDWIDIQDYTVTASEEFARKKHIVFPCSRPEYRGFWVTVVWLLLGAIAIVLNYLWWHNPKIWTLSLVFLMVIPLMVKARPFLGRVIVEDDKIRSVSLTGKTMCVISTDMTVYYDTLHVRVVGAERRYAVLSNRPVYLSAYNRDWQRVLRKPAANKYVVFLIDEKSASIIKPDWHKMSG